MEQLNLNITESSQVKVLSAHLQDAIIRVGDMVFLKPQNRFAAIGNRFCWEVSEKNRRIQCGFHFDGVEKTTYRGIDRAAPNMFLHLLAICFNEDSPPAGKIRLLFTENREICLEVEAIQIYLMDIGQAWNTKHRPQHDPAHPENK